MRGQMKNAANAFVALKVLDTQTDKAEDHDDLGVAELNSRTFRLVTKALADL